MEVRLDTSPLGDNRLNLWLRRRSEHVRLQQEVVDAVLESGAEAPAAKNTTLPGDARQLRGIPVVGLGVTGALPHTRPGFKLFRESAEERL